MEFINFYVMPGLLSGCIYALGAIGVTLIFGVLRFAHLAHGDMLTFGGFVGLAFVQTLGISPYMALPLAMVGGAMVAVAIDETFYSRLRTRPAIIVVMSSLGVALMLRALVLTIWGADPFLYVKGIQRPNDIAGLLVKNRELVILGATAVLVLVLHIFLTRTRWGKAMRAMSDNRQLAQFCGIDTRAVTRLTWIVGGGLAAAAGVFMGLNNAVDSHMGWGALLPIFAAAILGGVGNPLGAAAGGLIIGLAEELSTYPFIGASALISPAYKTAVAFAILVALLLWRPTGLFKGKVL